MTDRIEERLIDSLKPHYLNEQIYQDSLTADAGLIDSIKRYGFNDRIIIDKDDVVIAGHRRLTALKALKYETVPVLILEEDDPDKLIEYLIISNQTSRDRTQEQMAREFKVLKDIEERKAKERQLSAQNNNAGKAVKENCPQLQNAKGQSRDIAVKKLNAGISGKTAEKALKVVEHADSIEKDDPAKAQEIKDTLNNVSVNKAYEMIKETETADKELGSDKKAVETTTATVAVKDAETDKDKLLNELNLIDDNDLIIEIIEQLYNKLDDNCKTIALSKLQIITPATAPAPQDEHLQDQPKHKPQPQQKEQSLFFVDDSTTGRKDLQDQQESTPTAETPATTQDQIVINALNDKPDLKHADYTQWCKQLMIELNQAGLTNFKIKELLESHNIKTKRGLDKWAIGTVGSFVAEMKKNDDANKAGV